MTIFCTCQASLGESDNRGESVLMQAKVDDKKLAIGTLSAERFPQIQFNLIFEKKVELSHTSKTASVCFFGVLVNLLDEEGENNPVINENGKPGGKVKEQKCQLKMGAAAPKSKAENNKDGDGSDSDETDDSEYVKGHGYGMSEEDSSEDERTSKIRCMPDAMLQLGTGKKRAPESALKTAAPDKKAKVGTPSSQKKGARAHKFAPCVCPVDGCGFRQAPIGLKEHFRNDHKWTVTDVPFGRNALITIPENTQFSVISGEDGSVFLLSFLYGELLVVSLVHIRATDPDSSDENEVYKYELWAECPGRVTKVALINVANRRSLFSGYSTADEEAYLLIPPFLQPCNTKRQLVIGVCIKKNVTPGAPNAT